MLRILIVFVSLFLWNCTSAPVLKEAEKSAAPLRLACGTNGVIEDRLKDCREKNKDLATYIKGARNTADVVGNSSDTSNQELGTEWDLLQRTENGKEIWRDRKSDLAWTGLTSLAGGHIDARKYCLETPFIDPDYAEFGLPTREELSLALENDLMHFLKTSKTTLIWTGTSLGGRPKDRMYQQAYYYSVPESDFRIGNITVSARAICVGKLKFSPPSESQEQGVDKKDVKGDESIDNDVEDKVGVKDEP